MINFIRNYNLETIGKKFQLLFLFILTNLFMNIILTKIFATLDMSLLFSGSLYTNYIVFITLTAVVPGVLLLILYYRMKSANNIQLKKSNILVNFTLLFSLVPLCINFYNIYPLI